MTKREKLHLIRDVLDKQLVDSETVPLGRVDGIVLLVASDRTQPRVIQIESGVATLLRRLSTRWARWVQWLGRQLGVRWRAPVRIGWAKIDTIGREVMLKTRADNSPLLARERWLRDHLIRHIPGNGMSKKP
jgi:hypothetical protein